MCNEELIIIDSSMSDVPSIHWIERFLIFSDHTFVLFRKLSDEMQTPAVLVFAEQQLYLWSHEIPHLMMEKCPNFSPKGKLKNQGFGPGDT